MATNDFTRINELTQNLKEKKEELSCHLELIDEFVKCKKVSNNVYSVIEKELNVHDMTLCEGGGFRDDDRVINILALYEKALVEIRGVEYYRGKEIEYFLKNILLSVPMNDYLWDLVTEFRENVAAQKLKQAQDNVERIKCGKREKQFYCGELVNEFLCCAEKEMAALANQAYPLDD